MNHLTISDAISNRQYGFIHERSTVLQLLHFLDYCAEIMVKGGVLNVIYSDYVKAFDSVTHRRLLSKLESYGIKNQVLTWVENFLTRRSQSVRVNEERSLRAPVMSGIPQGSMFGIILFTIYFNVSPASIISIFTYLRMTPNLYVISPIDKTAMVCRMTFEEHKIGVINGCWILTLTNVKLSHWDHLKILSTLTLTASTDRSWNMSSAKKILVLLWTPPLNLKSTY